DDPAHGDYDEPHDNRYRLAVPTGDHQDDRYYADNTAHDGETYEDANHGRRRGGLITIAAVLGLAVIGTAGAFGYRALTGGPGSATPPVIKADTAPTKIQAATQATDPQKPINDRIGNTAERL